MKPTFGLYAKVHLVYTRSLFARSQHFKRRECYSGKKAFTIRLYIKDGAEALTNVPRGGRENDVV